ncbi:MAG: hypothetical protein ACOCX1_00255 [Fimbriimonadaceae bacterium]
MKNIVMVIAIGIFSCTAAAIQQPEQGNEVPPPRETIEVVRELIATTHERLNPYGLRPDTEVAVSGIRRAFLYNGLGSNDPYYSFEYYLDGSLKRLIHGPGSRDHIERKLKRLGEDLPQEPEWLTEQEVGTVVRRVNFLLQDNGYTVNFPVPGPDAFVNDQREPELYIDVQSTPREDGYTILGFSSPNWLEPEQDSLRLNRQTGEILLQLQQHRNLEFEPVFGSRVDSSLLDRAALAFAQHLPEDVHPRVAWRGLAYVQPQDHGTRWLGFASNRGEEVELMGTVYVRENPRIRAVRQNGSHMLMYVLHLEWGKLDPSGTAGDLVVYVDPVTGEVTHVSYGRMPSALFRGGSGDGAKAPLTLAWVPAADERAEAPGRADRRQGGDDCRQRRTGHHDRDGRQRAHLPLARRFRPAFAGRSVLQTGSPPRRRARGLRATDSQGPKLAQADGVRLNQKLSTEKEAKPRSHAAPGLL